MTVVPVVTPLTMPDDEPTVATVVLLLIQVPPAVASVTVIVEPAHTLVGPLIAAGAGLTVTTAVARQLPTK
jgi:hypothetical protein